MDKQSTVMLMEGQETKQYLVLQWYYFLHHSITIVDYKLTASFLTKNCHVKNMQQR